MLLDGRIRLPFDRRDEDVGDVLGHSEVGTNAAQVTHSRGHLPERGVLYRHAEVVERGQGSLSEAFRSPIYPAHPTRLLITTSQPAGVEDF